MMTFALLLGVALLIFALRRAAPTPPATGGPARQVPSGRIEALLQLPEPARSRAWSLLCAVQDSLQVGPGDPQSTYLLREVRDSYLPDTIEAYLRLPPSARAQLDRQGQSPEALLLDQLILLEGGVREAQRHDHTAADRLLAQGRFLSERFGPARDLKVENR